MYLNRLIRQLFFLITFGLMLSWLPSSSQAVAHAVKHDNNINLLARTN